MATAYAQDQAKTTIATLRETDEGFKSDVNDLMMARPALSTEMDLRFARTVERFARGDNAVPRVATTDPGKPL